MLFFSVIIALGRHSSGCVDGHLMGSTTFISSSFFFLLVTSILISGQAQEKQRTLYLFIFSPRTGKRSDGDIFM